jgi:hypothetical protein
MRLRMGVVQSTSSVVFLGIDIIGDWCAIVSRKPKQFQRWTTLLFNNQPSEWLADEKEVIFCCVVVKTVT